MNAANAPIIYDDSLKARAQPMKFRRVGNPYAFLNSIGIDAILERMYKAANLVDVAQELNISITILLNWIENEGHVQRIETAAKFSAEGWLSEAGRLLRSANTDFELKKAGKLADHGRFMASKLDKGKYGADNKTLGNTAGVTFNLHMGNATLKATLRDESTTIDPTKLPPPMEAGFINGTYSHVTPVLDDDPDIASPDDVGPFEPEPLEPLSHNLPHYLVGLNPYEPD